MTRHAGIWGHSSTAYCPTCCTMEWIRSTELVPIAARYGTAYLPAEAMPIWATLLCGHRVKVITAA